jgi:glycosyltransferase involved in cell wall biosynthesis
VAGLACALKNLGYDVRVRVLRLDGECGHHLPYLKANGVDISVPRKPSLADIKFIRQQGVDMSLIKHLPEEIRVDAIALTIEFLRRPVDIVHCYLDWCCCYGGFAALLSGVPAIRFSWRNANPTNFEFFIDWMPRIYKFMLQFPHVRVENNSSAGALDYTQWLELPQCKVEVMPNGIDAAWLRSSDEKCGATLRDTIGVASDAPLIVSTGRLVQQKRPLDLPDILLALRKRIPRASIVHIGDGPLRNDLQTLMARKGLACSMEKNWTDAAMFLLGRREDVFEILNCSDVFLLTSAHEGMPNVIMEAMLAGLPVVATRVGGVPDLIKDGVHGYLHDIGDIAGMARSLERLLADPDLRQKMGNAGREKILKEFTINHLVDRITRAYAAQCAA